MVLPPSTMVATVGLRLASSASGYAISAPSRTESTVIQMCSQVSLISSLR